MVNALAGPSVTFFVHVDARCEYDEDEFEAMLDEDVDLFMLEPRRNAEWGGFSLVQVTVKLMECCLLKGEYDYVSLLSGQDFPVTPSTGITEFLTRNKGMEFIEYFDLPNEKRWRGYFGMCRFEQFWMIDSLGFEACKFIVDQQLREGIKRTLPAGLTPYGGSQWFTITLACAKYIVEYLRQTPEFFSYFRLTLASDEVFFNTIIMNSPFAANVVNNNLRKIDWLRGPDFPRTFRESDLAELVSSNCLFARKFDVTIDDQVLTQIENYLNTFAL